MIIVRLMGGLGNQMFQYAAGSHLAQKHNTELKLDLSYINTKGNYTPRQYELNVFKIDPQFASDAEVESFINNSTWRYSRYVQRKLPFLFKKIYISESGRSYHPQFIHYPSNTYLEGFWQSEKYFLPIAEVIHKKFQFKEKLVDVNDTLAEKIRNTQSASLHVRRGDYLTNTATNQYHGVCSPEYYNSAVNLLQKEYKDICLFIFSDEPEWVKQNMKFDVPVEYINNNVGDKSYIDMQLMSLCKHNIIANSSFSWWGAWLNTNEGKKVIAPKNWFANETGNWNDIYAKDWITI